MLQAENVVNSRGRCPFSLFIAASIAAVVAFACKDAIFDKTNYDAVQLSVVDVSPTTVVLRLSIAAEVQFDSLTLYVNEGARWKQLTSSHDTLLFIEQLKPNAPYSFQSVASEHGYVQYKSRSLSVTTMDTTTHEYAWHIDTLGVGSSVLFDVAIVNDSLVYAVGQLYERDSLGQVDTEPYSVAVWDGRRWTLKRIYPRYTGYGNPPPVRARGIVAFSPTDVWLADGTVWQWDGESDTTRLREGPFPSPDAGSQKLWGTSGSNLYSVGLNGIIAHFDGYAWQSMASGTNIDLTDLFGSHDGRLIWACGFDDWGEPQSVVLTLRAGGAWQTIWNLATPTYPYVYQNYLSSLWISGLSEAILAGGGVYRHSLLDSARVRNEYLDLGNFAYRVRGSDRNNIMMVGDFAMVWHYNGQTWHRYSELLNQNDRLYGLAVSDHMVVAVGERLDYITTSALVITGSR